MKGRTLLLLGLFVLVAALGLAVLRTGSAPVEEAPRLLTLPGEAVNRMRIEVGDRPAVELVRREGGWHLLAPYAVPANPVQVESALRLTELRSQADYPLAGHDLREYGLEAPAVRVRLEQIEIAFGGTAPLDGQRYVRIGDRLHLVADILFYRLQAPPEAYVQPRLLPEEAAPIEIVLSDRRLRLEDGRWAAEPPLDSADAAVEWVGRWRRAQAVRVRPYRDEPVGGPVDLILQDRQRLRLLPLKDGTGLVRPELKLVYELPEGALGSLLHPPPRSESGPGSA